MSVNLGLESLAQTVVDEYVDDKSMSEHMIDLLQSQIEYQDICNEITEACRGYENLIAIQTCVDKHGSTEVLVDLIGFTPSTEGLGEMAKKAVNKIVEAIKKFITWIGNFIKKLFGIEKKTKTVAENIKNVKPASKEEVEKLRPATVKDLETPNAKLVKTPDKDEIKLSFNYKAIINVFSNIKLPSTNAEVNEMKQMCNCSDGKSAFNGLIKAHESDFNQESSAKLLEAMSLCTEFSKFTLFYSNKLSDMKKRLEKNLDWVEHHQQDPAENILANANIEYYQFMVSYVTECSSYLNDKARSFVKDVERSQTLSI